MIRIGASPLRIKVESSWPVIWKATLAKAEEDDSFAMIADPNIIEVGQKLWIPDESAAAGLLEAAEHRADGHADVKATAVD